MSKQTIEYNVKLGWTSLLVYLGIGFICHMFFIGSTIVWTDAFSLFMIALWPFYLFYLFLWVVAAIAIVAIAVMVIILVLHYCNIIK